MPRYSTVFQVFVASPSDVAEERSLLEGVISDLNQIWSKTLGITFELVRWETNVHPSFSNDPQAAINEQIGLEYDVFIGIFWGRIGTLTPRSISGTLEEFERAYARFLLNKNSPEIMIYFKDAAIQPSKIDTNQLQRVQTFRESLSEKGGLYSMFEDQAGFESSLRSHLSALAQKFSAEKANSPTERIPFDEQLAHVTSLVGEDDDDYGFLDYTEIYTSRLEEVNSAMNSIGSATARLSEQLVQRAAEMQAVDKNSAKDVRRQAKRAADDMNNFAEVVRPQIDVMSVGREVAFDALSKALALQIDFTTSESDLRSLKNGLCSLIAAADHAKIGTLTMKTATAGLPRLSKELNIAKRAVVFQLDAVASEFDKIIFTLTNIVEAVDKMIGE